MRLEEAWGEWQSRRLTQEGEARLLGVCERTACPHGNGGSGATWTATRTRGWELSVCQELNRTIRRSGFRIRSERRGAARRPGRGFPLRAIEGKRFGGAGVPGAARIPPGITCRRRSSGAAANPV